jgi:hypothetical protein
MPSLPCSIAPCLTLTTPHKRRRLAIPPTGRCLQPVDDLVWRLGMLPVQCASFQNPLDRFRHVEVRAAERSKEWHDAVGEEPEHEVRRMVPGEVIPDEQHTERWEVLGQGDPDRQPFLPALPAPSILLRWEDVWLGQGYQDRQQFVFQPGMQDSIGSASHAFHPHCSAGRMEERQLLGRAFPDVLVWIADRVACRMPVGAGIGQRSIRSCLVFRPHGQPGLGIRRLDQLFFAVASGSMTVTVPLFRFRTTVPVSHQL